MNRANRVWKLEPRALLVAASLFVSTSVLAGPAALTVQGRITGWDKLTPRVYAEAAADAHRHRVREASPLAKPDAHRLAASPTRDFCVAAFGPSAAAHEPLFVKVTGGRVTPSTIVVSPGSRITFQNVDPFPHVLFEVNDEKWTPNPMGPGSSRDWSAAAPGVHQIRDQLFPSVSMYIVVDPSAVEFAEPDHDGGFSMTIPPGDYTLKVFFEGKQVGRDIEGVHLRDRGFEVRDPVSVAGGDVK